MPYRDPSQPSPIKIKRINCSSSVEGWLMGTPEMRIKILGVDNNGKTTEIKDMAFDLYKFNQTYTNKLVLNWLPDSWYKLYTFYVWEEDPGKDKKVQLSANVNYKDTIGSLGLNIQAGTTMEFRLSQPEICGYADLNYFDPKNITLRFNDGKHWCEITFE
jgi:hypothetical protein